MLPLKEDSLGRDKDPIGDIKNLLNPGVGEERVRMHQSDQ
jgi:hypothetical protein